MIKVSNEVPVYEIDGTATSGIPQPTIGVGSHWNRDNFVVLTVDGKKITVCARDLKAAVDNSTNSVRHG